MTDPIERLAAILERLPGIGEKSAIRMSLAIVRAEPDYRTALSAAVDAITDTIRECSVCCDLTTAEVCAICSDARRDASLLCVVAHPQDRMAMERAAVYRGRYHVLHGVLDPLAGVGPGDLRFVELLTRVTPADAISEVIVATSPTVEGDVTAMYLARMLGDLGITVSRIAAGVAVGGDLEHADRTTLARALDERRAVTRKDA